MTNITPTMKTIDGQEVTSGPLGNALVVAYGVLDELVLRPLRALSIAYGYVLRGEKVTKPLSWGDI